MATKINAKKKKNPTTFGLKEIIIEAVKDKKGEEIILLDLREVQESVTDYFVICHVATAVQVKAIADNILIKVAETKGEYPFHKEGFNNLEWVLIDYVDIVAHIFIKSKREFYQLEELWDDATKYPIE